MDERPLLDTCGHQHVFYKSPSSYNSVLCWIHHSTTKQSTFQDEQRLQFPVKVSTLSRLSWCRLDFQYNVILPWANQLCSALWKWVCNCIWLADRWGCWLNWAAWVLANVIRSSVWEKVNKMHEMSLFSCLQGSWSFTFAVESGQNRATNNNRMFETRKTEGKPRKSGLLIEWWMKNEGFSQTAWDYGVV